MAGAPVLLIDELDRADEAFEAYLLEILSDFQVTIPELGTVKAPQPPIVIVTSNRTREIHDALKRRCLYHWVDYPSAERELAIVKSRVPGISAKLSQQVVGFVQALREQDFYKSPGVAETIDWATALTELDARSLTPQVVGDTLGALLKYQDDIARMQGDNLQKVLKEATSESKASSFRDAPTGAQARNPILHDAWLWIPGSRKVRAPRNDDGEGYATMPIDHLNPPTGLIADNVVGFARALRAAGIPVGPGAVIDALNALRVIDIGNRADVFTTLEAIFVKRHEHALVFAQAFDLFFRAAEEWKHMLDSIPLPDHAKKKPPPASRRVQEALSQPSMTEAPQAQEQELRLSVSDKEVLQKKDFAQMSAAEIAQVTRAIAQMKLPQAELRTRRYQPDARGLRLDLRRTLRGSLRTGGDIVDIRRLGLIDKPAPIVALLDISGSMSEYTRLFLHFLHAITDARKRVSVFLFGTRLTNVTRALRARDPDEALASCSSCGGGLGRRHPDRDLAAQLQQAVGPPRARAGRHRAADLRRAGARGRRQAGVRDGPAAPFLPPPDLAQPAAAVRRLRGQGAGHQNDAAAR